MSEFVEGKFYKGVEVDPRDSKLPDEKTDLSSLPGYTQGLSKQKTMLSDKGRAVKTISPGAEKYVNKFIEKARQKKAERRAKEAADNPDKEEDEITAAAKLANRMNTPKPVKVGEEEKSEA